MLTQNIGVLTIGLIFFVSILNTASRAETPMEKKRNSPVFPGKTWQKAKSPEELGWSTAGLKVARDYTSTIDTTAVMIVDDGVIVDEWGETATKSNVHSVRKSFLSAFTALLCKKEKLILKAR